MVKQMLADSVAHCYFPYDLNGAMRRFANAVRPRLGLVMETEIWPEMISAIKAVGSHLMYTNVRLSERSYQNYARFREFIGYTLEQVDFFAVQGKADAHHLELLGVASRKIAITGSIKFDVQIPASLHEMAEVTRRQLGNDRLIFIAGSTRDGEEGRILEAYKVLKREFPYLLLLLVPRHPERFDYVARKTARRGLKIVRRTEGGSEVAADVDVYLGDTMGELSLLYASSDVAFVGGSLEPFGGQNILEPCALGVPVLFGPHMFNFPDISKWTIREGAGLMVHSSKELITELRSLLGNASRRDSMGRCGLDFIEAHRGALDKNIELFTPILKELE
jgi:3-deoxy-D-manno-octulosonic-acid transferase